MLLGTVFEIINADLPIPIAREHATLVFETRAQTAGAFDTVTLKSLSPARSLPWLPQDSNERHRGIQRCPMLETRCRARNSGYGRVGGKQPIESGTATIDTPTAQARPEIAEAAGGLRDARRCRDATGAEGVAFASPSALARIMNVL